MGTFYERDSTRVVPAKFEKSTKASLCNRLISTEQFLLDKIEHFFPVETCTLFGEAGMIACFG
jgi:hypothetical protein